jgi:hypothetical protein
MTQDKRARGAALNFKLRPDDVARLDAAIMEMDNRNPGISHTRADVVRTALAELARVLGCEVAT